MKPNLNDKHKQQIIELFHHTYQNCRAYHKFIKSHHIKPSQINSVVDYDLIPITDRYNYLNQYPLKDRILSDKQISDFYLITTSSGSSGKPTFWLRDKIIDDKIVVPKELFYEDFFSLSKHRTLIVVTFAMGMWLGGLLETMLAIEISRKYKVSVITPGMNLKNAISCVKELQNHFDQIIILGYPPFITDFLDSAKTKFNLTKIPIKIILTGDRFSEHWRQVALNTINSTNHADVVGIYGCSDSGIIGTESRFTIDLLKNLVNKPKLIKKLFHSIQIPTLVTYNPQVKFIENVGDEIVISANQPIPLIRYNIHDRGSIIPASLLREIADELHVNYTSTDLNQHYVCVHGRTDSVLVNAANVYIDDIKYCLQHSPYVQKFSEQFQYGSIETRGLKNRLKVILYLKPKAKILKNEKLRLEQQFYEDLKYINADFKVLYENTKTENFLFIYRHEIKDNDKFHNTKLKYILPT